jgi:hypothetical protein
MRILLSTYLRHDLLRKHHMVMINLMAMVLLQWYDTWDNIKESRGKFYDSAYGLIK